MLTSKFKQHDNISCKTLVSFIKHKNKYKTRLFCMEFGFVTKTTKTQCLHVNSHNTPTFHTTLCGFFVFLFHKTQFRTKHVFLCFLLVSNQQIIKSQMYSQNSRRIYPPSTKKQKKNTLFYTNFGFVNWRNAKNNVYTKILTARQHFIHTTVFLFFYFAKPNLLQNIVFFCFFCFE